MKTTRGTVRQLKIRREVMLAYFICLTLVSLFAMFGLDDSRETLPLSLIVIVGMILTLVVRLLS